MVRGSAFGRWYRVHIRGYYRNGQDVGLLSNRQKGREVLLGLVRRVGLAICADGAGVGLVLIGKGAPVLADAERHRSTHKAHRVGKGSAGCRALS